jgi:hypothetical protein
VFDARERIRRCEWLDVAHAGPISITSSYMVTLWLVTLVVAPLLAFRNPVRHRAALDVYLLGC